MSWGGGGDADGKIYNRAYRREAAERWSLKSFGSRVCKLGPGYRGNVRSEPKNLPRLSGLLLLLLFLLFLPLHPVVPYV